MPKTRFWISTSTALAAAAILVTPRPAAAPEVRLKIEKGFGEKVIVAVPLFEGSGAGGVEAGGIREVLTFDLGNSGYFSITENLEFVDETERDDRRTGEIDFQEWLALGAEIMIKGKFEAGVSEFVLEASAYDLAQGQGIFARRYTGAPADWRRAVHRLSDDIVNRLTGETGIAESRIAFVSNATGAKEIYVMDYDGENRRRMTRDSQIAMYPAWFPGSGRIAYTRYRGTRQEIHAVDVPSGSTGRLTSFPGLNAFAAISPRGNEILMTLSRDGNPEIYRVSSNGSDPKRLTFGRSTESSPGWSPAGRRPAVVSASLKRPLPIRPCSQ